jgi:transcriptional regulator with XRE-family HTH domain
MPIAKRSRRKPPSKRRLKLERIEFGARLRQIRHDRGLTQEEVGAALGCYPSNVSMFEAGKHNPSLARLRALARLYECSIDELTAVGTPVPANVSVAHKG